MVAEMIASASSNKDYKFPQGISGDFITASQPYQVPSNKGLYLTNYFSTTTDLGTFINGSLYKIARQQVGPYEEVKFSNPIILDENFELNFDDQSTISGILLEKNTDLDILNIYIDETTDYVIPSGKKLVLLNIVKNSGTSNSVLFIDNKPIYNSTSYNNTLHQPLFLGSNQEISTNSNVGGSVYYVNGYLVDEDYFD